MWLKGSVGVKGEAEKNVTGREHSQGLNGGFKYIFVK